MYTKHLVSTKLALYSHDKARVLTMHYLKSGWNGLPGGHVEKNETPDDALRRELNEELALSVGGITRKDFFLREGKRGSIVLAYTAIAPEDVVLSPTAPRVEVGVWVEKDKVNDIPFMTPEYKRFILENWPN